MTSLHVICGLAPPNQKSWLRLWSHVLWGALKSKQIITLGNLVMSDRHVLSIELDGGLYT